MQRLVSLCAVGLLLLAGCGSSSSTDGGTVDSGASDAGAPDSGSGTMSECGMPGDMGNALGIGAYCQTGSDCTSDAGNLLLCSSIENSPTTPTTYFCTMPCSCTDPAGTCGANAECACLMAGACGCIPTKCAALAAQYASMGGGVCLPDGGLGGAPDAGH